MYIQADYSRLGAESDSLANVSRQLEKNVWALQDVVNKLSYLSGMEDCCYGLNQQMEEIDRLALSVMMLGEGLRRISEHYSSTESNNLTLLENRKIIIGKTKPREPN